MQKKCNKKLLSLILSMMLIVAMAFNMTACGDNNVETPKTENQSQAGGTEEGVKQEGENGDQILNNVLGEGQTVFDFVVVDKDGNETKFEIHTDKTTVGEALLELELVEGEEYNTYTVNADLQIAFKMMDVDVKDCDYVVVKFAEPVAAGWKLAFWSNQDLVDVPEGATEFKYVFAEDSKCGVVNGVLPQICMMTFFGGFTAPLEAKVVGIYKHVAGVVDAIEDVEAAAPVNGKFIENGKIVIIKNGKKFNMAGVAIQ